MSDEPAPAPGKPRRGPFRVSVRTLLLLVAISSLLIWSSLRIWEQTTQNQFIRVLQYGDTVDRRVAARELVAAPKPGEVERVLSALVLALGDEDAQVRAAAANSLGSVMRGLLDGWKPAPEELQAHQPLVSVVTRGLLGRLQDGDAEVRREALRALVAVHFRTMPLGRSGSQPYCLGFEPCDGTLRDDVRVALVATLADPAPEFRGLAAWVLGNIGPFLSPGIPRALVEHMQDPDDKVRLSAGTACSNYKEGLRPLLPELFTRLEAVQPLFRLALRNCLRQAEADPSLVPVLRDRLRSKVAEVRECAAYLLYRLGPQAVASTPELLVVLQEPFVERKPEKSWPDDQPNPARQAAWALACFPASPEILDALSANLKSAIASRRSDAASALSSIGPPARTAIPALIAAFQAEPRSGGTSAAWSCAEALSKLAPNTEFADAAVAVLTEALKSRDLAVRSAAATALGRFGASARSALAALRAVASDPAAEPAYRPSEAATRAIQAIEAALSGNAS